MAAYEACQATFAALNDENASESRALRLDKEQPRCRCEASSASEYSSGRVEDGEVLLRILVAPQHMTNKRLPRAAALVDAERNGLSLFREEQTTDEEIRSVADGLVARARSFHGGKAGVFGVLRMVCGGIRRCRGEGEADPCYCVYDTAQKDIRSHAEIFQRVAGVSEAMHEDRRRKLFSLVKADFVPVSDFRGGLLSDFAPQS